jgi:hypothetical protein
VLLGALSPLQGVGPDDLKIRGLLDRIGAGGVEEVILATNPTVEGEALYGALRLRTTPPNLTARLARTTQSAGKYESRSRSPVHREQSHASAVPLSAYAQGVATLCSPAMPVGNRRYALRS